MSNTLLKKAVATTAVLCHGPASFHRLFRKRRLRGFTAAIFCFN